MRQHYGMHLGVRQIKTAAQGMTQLVVQSHTHAAQHTAAQPSPIQSQGPALGMLRIRFDHWQRLGQ